LHKQAMQYMTVYYCTIIHAIQREERLKDYA
jgi:hypothetical protein